MKKILHVTERKHMNINKLGQLSWDWVGVKDLLISFLAVIPFGGQNT